MVDIIELNKTGIKMIITRNILLSEKTNSMELPISEEQVARYVKGEPVSQVFKNSLTPEQLIFLATGVDVMPVGRVLELETSEYRSV